MRRYLEIPNYIVQVWSGFHWMDVSAPMRMELCKRMKGFLTGGDSNLHVRILYAGEEV